MDRYHRYFERHHIDLSGNKAQLVALVKTKIPELSLAPPDRIISAWEGYSECMGALVILAATDETIESFKEWLDL